MSKIRYGVKCEDCGWHGHDSELKYVREDRGEFWGMPAYETMAYCPHCGSDYLEDYYVDDFLEEVTDDEDEELDPETLDELAEDKYFESLGVWDIDLAKEVSFAECYD